MNNEITPVTEYIDLDELFDLEAWLDGMAVDAGRGALVIRTPVWLAIGLTRSVPAALQVAGGRVALGTGALPMFDVKIGELAGLRSPWWWFGGEIRFRAENEAYRVSFVRPNDAEDGATHLFTPRPYPTAGVSGAGCVGRQARAGRAIGRTCRALLAGRSRV